MTNKYKEVLQNVISNNCNAEGYYEVYWDHDDEIEPDTIRKAVTQDDFDPYDYISDTLLQYNEDYIADEMMNKTQKAIYATGDAKLIAEYHDSDSIFEDLYDSGYRGVNLNVNELLERTILKVNFTFATDQEQNYDMGSIVGAYGSYRLPNTDYAAEYLDNALTYLIRQQGHKVTEVYQSLFDNPEGWVITGNFVDSVVNEIVNNSSESMSELCILVKMNAKEYLEMCAALKEKKHFKLKFAKDSTVGIFNEWAGCGSLFGIELEKDFVVPSGYIREITLDAAAGKYTYSVGRTYDMSTGAWQKTVSYTEETIELTEEDLIDVSEFFTQMLVTAES